MIGPNGAGKTTLFGALVGMIPADDGTVVLDGRVATGWSAAHRARVGIGRTFQRLEVFGSMTVLENLSFAAEAAALAGHPWRLLTRSRHRDDRWAEEVLDLLELGPFAHRVAGSLPLGVGRRIELGRALCTRPRLLLLDEPSSGLDPGETAMVADTVANAVASLGVGALLIEHDMSMVRRLCERLYVLEHGRCIAVRTHRRGGRERGRARGLPGQERRMSSAPVLSVRGLRAGYGGGEVLHGVDLDLAEGGLVAVLGANGAGKSTLLAAIAGHVRPRAGGVLLEGVDLAGCHAEVVSRCGLYLVPEGKAVFPSLSVLENLRLSSGAPEPALAPRVQQAFELFPQLADRRAQAAGTMSGGEQRMLALARAFVADPRVLLLDEPSLGLAPKVVDEVFQAIAGFQSLGTSVVLVEQYVHRALSVADAAVVLASGRMVWSGAAAELDEADLADRYLGGAPTAATVTRRGRR